ncbi:MAG: SDR family oxidoreductase [Cyclobacteriaceae bacterium]|jgi:NAD(P)-dependent dehydrogenase (short-subunit alcohol dehydrogenase family)|nr:SDR family oxidoreductase [Cyclobacteriaceae bacterium]
MKKNYLVIGGSTGIGLALARHLKAQGHGTWVAARRTIIEPGIESQVFDAVREDASALTLPDALDGLAYCPGSINLKPFHRLTDQEFTDDFQLNVMGAVKAVRSLLPRLKAADTASVVFFSTVAVAQGMPFHASVAAAKGALEGLTKSLAAEWAPKIRVNCIAPSLTDTPLAARLLASDEKKKASAERHPLKRVGEAEDIANMAAFLLSDQARWISGQILGVDGGMSTLRV